MQQRYRLPPSSKLKEIFSYDAKSGSLIWNPRNFGRMSKAPGCASWNTKYAGTVAGWKNQQGFLAVTLNGKRFLVHRLVYKMSIGKEPFLIDHIDHDPSNNRIENLRSVDHAQNSGNMIRQSRNTSGYKGVYWDKYIKRWVGRVAHRGKRHRAGVFDSSEAAFKATCKLRKELHGEFACDGV